MYGTIRCNMSCTVSRSLIYTWKGNKRALLSSVDYHHGGKHLWGSLVLGTKKKESNVCYSVILIEQDSNTFNLLEVYKRTRADNPKVILGIYEHH